MPKQGHLRPQTAKPGLLTTYYSRDKDKFPEGSPIRQALQAGRTVTVFAATGEVAWIQRKGEFYDLAGNRIDRSHPCGAPVKTGMIGLPPRQSGWAKAAETRTCQRKVKGLTGRCYQHRGS